MPRFKIYSNYSNIQNSLLNLPDSYNIPPTNEGVQGFQGLSGGTQGLIGLQGTNGYQGLIGFQGSYPSIFEQDILFSDYLDIFIDTIDFNNIN